MTQEELKAHLTQILSDRAICGRLIYVRHQSAIPHFTNLFNGFISGLRLDYVDSYGGESMGSEYYSVIKFSLGDTSVLVKFEGSYASYNGADYEQWRFVEAKKVEVTQYV